MLANKGRQTATGNRNILRVGVLGAVAALLASGLTLGAGAAGYAEDTWPPPTSEVQPAEVEIEVDEPTEQPPTEQPPTEQPPAEQPPAEQPSSDDEGEGSDGETAPGDQKPHEVEPEQPNLAEEDNAKTPVEPGSDVAEDPTIRDLSFEVGARYASREPGPDLNANALNFGFLGLDDETSVWDLQRKGVEIDAAEFTPNVAVTIRIGTGTPIPAQADANGYLQGLLRGVAGPGTHNVTLTPATGAVQSDELTVFSDASWWANFNDTPSASPDWGVMSTSRLAGTGNKYYVTDFPYDTYVDMYVNGTLVETIHHPYHFNYLLKRTYSPGNLNIEFRHPVKTLKTTLTVVPNTAGTKPQNGVYAGTTVQTHASSSELESRTSRKFRFNVDESGKLTGIAGTYWWACVTGGYHGSGFSQFEDSNFPATRITKDRPFEVKWSTTSTSYTLSGVVRSNGSASGKISANLGVCGSSHLTWKTGQTSQAFVDVPKSHKFNVPIQWMHTSGLSTGTRRGGVAYYYPKQGVTREAMAAFLYRLSGSPAFSAPKTSPFADMSPSSKFYKEITWLAKTGITTGVKQHSGKPKYLPKATVTREAMAAFLYRYEESPKFSAPKTSPFADMRPSGKFYKEITWLAKQGITTGVKQPTGKPKYQPKNKVTREAMAAFIYRLEH